MIRVLVVEDSPTARARIVALIAAAPDLQLVGEAATGARAIELAVALRPDVVTLDLELPDTTGLAVTEHLMAHAPVPILVVSSPRNRDDRHDPYAVLAAGAVDVLDKPELDDSEADWDARFTAALRMVARIKVITHPRARLGVLGRPRGDTRAGTANPGTSGSLAGEVTTATFAGSAAVRVTTRQIIALGASTGGPTALADVIGAIDPACPLPIVVCLHIDAAFAGSFASWLGSETSRSVRIAAHGEPIGDRPGRVLLAPPGHHLVIHDRHAQLTLDSPRHHCRPSVDVLFESIATDYGPGAIAAVLTGMGRDGAAGLLAIRRAGGATFAQDAATSVVYGMPREAAANGGAERVLPIDELGAALAAAAGIASPPSPRTRSR